jgi:hypothetical protein
MKFVLSYWDPDSPTSFDWGVGTSFAASQVTAYAVQALHSANLSTERADSARVRDVVFSQVTITALDWGAGGFYVPISCFELTSRGS